MLVCFIWVGLSVDGPFMSDYTVLQNAIKLQLYLQNLDRKNLNIDGQKDKCFEMVWAR